MSAYGNNSRKQTAPLTDTLFNSRGCPLTRELTVFIIVSFIMDLPHGSQNLESPACVTKSPAWESSLKCYLNNWPIPVQASHSEIQTKIGRIEVIWSDGCRIQRWGLHHIMWLNVSLGKVNLETCWPAVYLMGCPTCPQGLPVTQCMCSLGLLCCTRWSLRISRKLVGRFAPLSLGKYVRCFSPLVFQCDWCRGVGWSQGRHDRWPAGLEVYFA